MKEEFSTNDKLNIFIQHFIASKMDNYFPSSLAQLHEVEYIISFDTKHEFASKQEVYLIKRSFLFA